MFGYHPPELNVCLLTARIKRLRNTAYERGCVRAVFCMYALTVFEWRRRKITRKDPGGYDDPIGPPLLTVALMATLFGVAWVTALNPGSSTRVPRWVTNLYVLLLFLFISIACMCPGMCPANITKLLTTSKHLPGRDTLTPHSQEWRVLRPK